ncbi:MAG: FHA domain-containing protein [Solirubrobacterales bacterium]
MHSNPGLRVFETGRVVGAGSFICLECGVNVTLEALEAIPECATCGETRFRRASLFEQPTTDTIEVEPESEPEWLHRTRDRLVADGRKGQFLAFESDDGASVVPVSEGWSRIGRSVSAEIRLDDPTVSRRHAVVVRTPQGGLRVLDDRSLNGVFVNGESVDWGRLLDGDELAIGRYRLHVIDTSATAAGADIPLHAVNG